MSDILIVRLIHPEIHNQKKKEDVMDVELEPVKRSELESVWKMQIEAFSDLLKKYQDYDTNPVAEGIDKINERMDLVYYEKN